MVNLNSYVKTKFVWTKEDGTEVDLSKYIRSISTNENFDPQNNTCSLELLDNDDIYTLGSFEMQEGDQVIVYAKVVTSNSDTTFGADDVIWEGFFIDQNRKETPDSKTVELLLVDYNYDLMNRIWGKDYNSLSKTTDEIITDITNSLLETESGLGTYKVGTSNIDTTRTDGSAFPTIEPSFNNKPVYEWIQELGQTYWTNSSAEISSGSLVHTKSMIYKIRAGEAYWYYPAASTVLTVDTDTTIVEIKQATGNQGKANFLILECGEDFDGEPIFTYIYDETSESRIQKDAYEPYLKLAGKDTTYDNTYHSLRKNAIAAGTSSSDFADDVRDLAEAYSVYWFEYVNKGRTEIIVTLPKQDVALGERVEIDLNKYESGEYVIDRISHNISSNAWTTQLTLIKEP